MSKSKYTFEFLAPIVAKSISIPDVLRACNLKITGSNRNRIKWQIKRFGINTDHFIKQQETFLKRDSYCPTVRLRRYIISCGRRYVCEECGLIPEWRGKPLTLHIDHINGDKFDNRLDNLRFMCPNCHQQTETWGKGKRVYG